MSQMDPYEGMTDRTVIKSHCPHGIDRISRYCEVCDAAMDRPEQREKINELRECLILAVKELEALPKWSVYTLGIVSRSRKALGLQ